MSSQVLRGTGPSQRLTAFPPLSERRGVRCGAQTRADYSQRVKGDIKRVFQYVSNAQTWPEWMPGEKWELIFCDLLSVSLVYACSNLSKVTGMCTCRGQQCHKGRWGIRARVCPVPVSHAAQHCELEGRHHVGIFAVDAPRLFLHRSCMVPGCVPRLLSTQPICHKLSCRACPPWVWGQHPGPHSPLPRGSSPSPPLTAHCAFP